MSSGFKQYNEIQKALSKELKGRDGFSYKESGKKFHELASGIYHKTKEKGFAIDNIDILVDNELDIPTYPALLPESVKEFFHYFYFAGKESKWTPETASGNLLINSFTTTEREIPATSFTYDNYLQEFTKFCNENQGQFTEAGEYGPEIRFTEPVRHPTKKGYFISELVSDDPENNYGFIAGQEDLDYIAPTPKEEEDDQQPDPEKEDKIEAAKDKAQQRLIEIKKLENEGKKLDIKSAKAGQKKLKEYNKAVDKLESLFDKGLITKAQFRKRFDELKV